MPQAASPSPSPTLRFGSKRSASEEEQTESADEDAGAGDAGDDVSDEDDAAGLSASKVRHIEHVQIGKFELSTWYHSPYPGEYRTKKKLFLCEFCLKYCAEYRSLDAHSKECHLRMPPGKVIYDTNTISVFEVDGAKAKLYCQCLTLFAKMFIDHKTLYFDVEPFIFYILTEKTQTKRNTIAMPNTTPHATSPSSPSPSSSSSSPYTADPTQTHQIVGYFSKEKQSPDQFNLSCILTFPQYQRKGYGKFLIGLSYELSRREHRLGSPEKPLSELGKVSYISYWVDQLLTLLIDAKNHDLTIPDLCTRTAIKKEDCISALESVHLIQYVDGEHQLDCTSKASKDLLAHHKHRLHLLSAISSSDRVEFDQRLLKWSPPPQSLTSPSVRFTDTNTNADTQTTSARKSNAKKRIKY